MGVWNGINILEYSLVFLIKINSSYNPSIHLLGMNRRKMRNICLHRLLVYLYMNICWCTQYEWISRTFGWAKAAKRVRVDTTWFHLSVDLKQVNLTCTDRNVMAAGVGLGGCLRRGRREYFSVLKIFCLDFYDGYMYLCTYKS